MTAKQKEETPVYVRLTYDEAVQAKRDILSLQGDLLRIIKIIRTYKALRLQELRSKAKAYRKIKELILSIKKVKTELPKVKVPQIKREENKKTEIKMTEKDYDLEHQLQEIQEKLKAIGG